ncbi:MAG: hypothetical protein D4S01_07415 [Dehalococcoidia bacterium]|nr:MAG: hypothetical protein D4S01_07415 [Dehalococcoidia bacterium]
MKGYIFGIFHGGECIDETSLDEDDIEHAKFLFYDEFGYARDLDVKLIRVDEEEDFDDDE